MEKKQSKSLFRVENFLPQKKMQINFMAGQKNEEKSG
jgi:hypothetical protein